MNQATLVRRIERLEQLARSRTKFSTECICFPENEWPFFGFAIEEEIARGVQCPIHGRRRFVTFQRLYLPKWRREMERDRPTRMSQQYQKAWNASFPPKVWPADEEESSEGQIFLRLKDGTRIPT